MKSTRDMIYAADESTHDLIRTYLVVRGAVWITGLLVAGITTFCVFVPPAPTPVRTPEQLRDSFLREMCPSYNTSATAAELMECRLRAHELWVEEHGQEKQP